MSRFRPSALFLCVGFALAGTTGANTVSAADLVPPVVLDIAQLNSDEPVCDDLNAFVNSTWLAANPVPSDRTTWGTFETLTERSLGLQQQIAEEAAAATSAKGNQKLIGDVFATGMDAEAINRAGVAPIRTHLAAIDALESSDDIVELLRQRYSRGQALLFGFGSSPDFQNSSQMIAYATQGGLSLPERGYYLLDREDYSGIREAFVAHVQRTLELAGVSADEAKDQAADVMAFEKRLAEVSLAPVELRNPAVFYNPVDIAAADAVTPNFSWNAFFASQGIDAPEMFSLAQPKFFAEVSTMLEEVPVDQWQAYMRYHTINGAAPFLSDALAEENFGFYDKTLRGQSEMQPRWKRVLGTINGLLGEALGQVYVERAFPPESKAAALELVNNLSAALKTRIEGLDWMGDETKARALEKWAAFTPKIGYPDKWRDYSSLSTSRDSYVGNILAALAFNHRRDVEKIGKPVDRTEWAMSPQTVNAYYNPLQNEIVFPAAILQPPFFDAKADPALNYGGIGAVIGHEMIHGYDDQGSKFDAKGNFSNWWTDEDRKGFEARTAKLVDQFDHYEAIDGLHVKGELTLGENIADLGGLSVAYDALQRALEESPEWQGKTIDGYTQSQRFFMNWATVWRRNFKPEELKVRLDTDSHAPASFRAIGAPSNMTTFASAFACKAGDPMVRDEPVRVEIW